MLAVGPGAATVPPVRLAPQCGHAYKAVVLDFTKDVASLPLVLYATLPGDGGQERLRRVWTTGPYAIAELPDTAIASVDVGLETTVETRDLRLAEVWFYANTPRSE